MFYRKGIVLVSGEGLIANVGELQDSADSVFHGNFSKNVMIYANNSKQWDQVSKDGEDKLDLAIKALGVGNSKGLDFLVNIGKDKEITEREIETEECVKDGDF